MINRVKGGGVLVAEREILANCFHSQLKNHSVIPKDYLFIMHQCSCSSPILVSFISTFFLLLTVLGGG